MREASGEHYVSSSDYGELAALLMKRHPTVIFEEIAEKPKSSGLLARFLGPLASNDNDSDDDPEEGIDAWLEWVAVAPQERATRLAGVVRTRLAGVVRYAVNEKETGKMRWSKIALKLIAAAPDPLPVLNAFVNRSKRLRESLWQRSRLGTDLAALCTPKALGRILPRRRRCPYQELGADDRTSARRADQILGCERSWPGKPLRIAAENSLSFERMARDRAERPDAKIWHKRILNGRSAANALATHICRCKSTSPALRQPASSAIKTPHV